MLEIPRFEEIKSHNGANARMLYYSINRYLKRLDKRLLPVYKARLKDEDRALFRMQKKVIQLTQLCKHYQEQLKIAKQENREYKRKRNV